MFDPQADRPDGEFDVRWVHGSSSPRHPSDPPIQSHRYDDRTVIFRESKDVSFEAPFLYLFLGRDRALLLDSGATADPRRFPLREAVEAVVGDWLRGHPREDYELVVAHTHSHGDHVAGDGQFAGRGNTRIVGKDPDSVRSFFHLGATPGSSGGLDLGDRALEVFPIPGHHPTSIAVYDPTSGLLVTGDTVYPGRLYVRDMSAFLASLNRLVEFASRRPVKWVVGCHIEMTRTPGLDYPIGTRYQPEEPPLQFSPRHLTEVRDAAVSVAQRPGAHVFSEFIIFNGPCRSAVWKEIARGWRANLWHRLRGP